MVDSERKTPHAEVESVHTESCGVIARAQKQNDQKQSNSASR